MTGKCILPVKLAIHSWKDSYSPLLQKTSPEIPRVRRGYSVYQPPLHFTAYAFGLTSDSCQIFSKQLWAFQSTSWSFWCGLWLIHFVPRDFSVATRTWDSEPTLHARMLVQPGSVGSMIPTTHTTLHQRGSGTDGSNLGSPPVNNPERHSVWSLQIKPTYAM